MTPLPNDQRKLLKLKPRELAALCDAIARLHDWYAGHKRALPWRDDPAPYRVWVSEIMLQQTRVAAVIDYFERWMDTFPTLQALAEADEERVLKLWEGLGYYSRARNLHKAARQVLDGRDGEIPEEVEELKKLPGVGPYTAAAIGSIAFGRDAAVVDGNVKRVLGRLVALEELPTRAPVVTALTSLADELLLPGHASDHNQAMMELGALVCTPKSPACPRCPMNEVCKAFNTGKPERFPPRAKKKPVPHHDVAIGLVFHNEMIFIDRRPPGGLLGGLWEFPGGKVESGETVELALERELAEEFGMRVRITGRLGPVDHVYTHLRVTLHPRLCRLVAMDEPGPDTQPFRWISTGELSGYAMPRANRKILELLAKRDEKEHTR